MVCSDLLLAGNSVRALAQAGRREGGRRIVAVDAFADQDTRAAADLCVPATGMSAADLAAAARPWAKPGAALIYGAGFEADPEALATLTTRDDCLGNRPQLLALLNRPAHFFDLLDRLGIGYPASRLSRPDNASGWLHKASGSSGGWGVRWAEQAAGNGDGYYQQWLRGPVVSCLFLADGERCRVIGFNRLFGSALAGRPFVYGGAINRTSLSASLQWRIADYAGRLTSALGLRGLNGIDCVIADDRALLLDLNPRPPATIELHQPRKGPGLLALHIEGCRGHLPQAAEDTTAICRAQHLLYARQPLVVPGLRWPDWASDRPAPGSCIEAGQPVCSVQASGSDWQRVLRLLTSRASQIRRLIGQTTQTAEAA